MKKLIIVVLVLLITACADHVALLKQKHYKSWPPHIQKAVDQKKVIIGMNKTQVMVATGFTSGSVNGHLN